MVSGWTLLTPSFSLEARDDKWVSGQNRYLFFGSWQSHSHQLISKKKQKQCSDSSAHDTASGQNQVARESAYDQIF